MSNKTDEAASKLLGKKVSGSKFYDPSLLVAVPRFENRKQYNIDNKNLPFVGWDVWHAYEFSCMTKKGVPITRAMKLRYNATSEYIIESKSLKLYLNSFNMSNFGENIEDCLNICKKIIEEDLSKTLKTEVHVSFLKNNIERMNIFHNFKNIMGKIDESNLEITKFKEAPELIETEHPGSISEHYLSFDSLRSNCRVTHQPDFGDAFIYYKSSKKIKEESLVKYLSSFRSEYHFHEECCEMIYKRLYDVLDEDDELLVCALYTRRGGIDICPIRWSKNCTILEDVLLLMDTEKYTRGTVKQ